MFWCIVCFIPYFAFANTFIEKSVWWYKIKVIEYNLSSNIYDIKVIKTDEAKSLWKLLEENNAITGVNGVFFCPVDYSWCNTTKSFTDSERYIVWEKFASYLTTWDRAVFAWTKDKKPFIFQSWKINMDDEDKIYYWLGNYPLLLSEWKNMLEYYYEAGLIFPKLTYKSTRNFVCSDKEKKNIYFWLVYQATIDELVQVLSEFWCYDALNLDAWASTAFIYNGKYLVWPQPRDILDAVVIERKWFNVMEISQISQKITKILIDKMLLHAKNNKQQFIKYVENYIQQWENIKSKIYEKYSTDIYENNFVWENEKVWYKIEMNDLKPLKMVYLFNQILYNLKLIKKEIQIKIDKENKPIIINT